MFNIDTTKVKNCGEEITKLSEDLGYLIDDLYLRIHNMPTKTFEWVGGAAELFALHAENIEYKDAIAFKNTLKIFGETLVSSAEKYEIENKNNM